MKEDWIDREFRINTDAVLQDVGVVKTVNGKADVTVREAYELLLEPGGNVSWKIDMRRIAGGVELTGSVAGEVELVCHRCLESYRFSFDTAIHETVVMISEIDYEEEILGEYVVEEGMLDLLPVLRDKITLSFPTRRICSEDCLGLCVKCGVNLNTDECSCARDRIDIRLKPLEDLKRKMEAKGKGGND